MYNLLFMNYFLKNDMMSKKEHEDKFYNLY